MAGKKMACCVGTRAFDYRQYKFDTVAIEAVNLDASSTFGQLDETSLRRLKWKM